MKVVETTDDNYTALFPCFVNLAVLRERMSNNEIEEFCKDRISNETMRELVKNILEQFKAMVHNGRLSWTIELDEEESSVEGLARSVASALRYFKVSLIPSMDPYPSRLRVKQLHFYNIYSYANDTNLMRMVIESSVLTKRSLSKKLDHTEKYLINEINHKTVEVQGMYT